MLSSEHKSGKYQRIIQQLHKLLSITHNPVSRMATVAALLYHKMGYFYWIGFYCLIDGELLVGPYQGTLACQALKTNTGVCWAGIRENKYILVPDVQQFSGHIACDPRSKSEIVVPVRDSSGNVCGVLDGDSDQLNMFDTIDVQYMQIIADMIYCFRPV